MPLITSISAFKDNYIWLIIESSLLVWIVDPGDATLVIEYFKKNPLLKPAGILLTHHHKDHSGGVEEVYKCFNIPVIASYRSKIKATTLRVKDKDVFELPQSSLTVTIFETPGHTLDHITFIIEDAIFCGDTLFTAGCGRIFEGDPEMMWRSLQKIANLKEDMHVYCGHEYTEANLRFALAVEPNNPRLQRRYEEVKALRRQNLSTVPEFLEIEKTTNPFLRVETTTVKQSVEKWRQRSMESPVEVFTALREWKNHF